MAHRHCYCYLRSIYIHSFKDSCKISAHWIRKTSLSIYCLFQFIMREVLSHKKYHVFSLLILLSITVYLVSHDIYNKVWQRLLCLLCIRYPWLWKSLDSTLSISRYRTQKWSFDQNCMKYTCTIHTHNENTYCDLFSYIYLTSNIYIVWKFSSNETFVGLHTCIIFWP